MFYTHPPPLWAARWFWIRGRVNAISSNSMFRRKDPKHRKRDGGMNASHTLQSRGETKSSQCERTVFGRDFLPPPQRKCPFTAYTSVVCHHILSPSSEPRCTATLKPGDVAALELNQAGRRRGSPYFAISTSARSARAYAASNGGWQHEGGEGVARAAARCVLTVSRLVVAPP